MQAIILAAGMGKRLKQLTRNNTKCMVKVNGIPLINRTLRQLEQHCLSRIIIVTGYEGENLKNHINSLELKTPVVFIHNPVYDKTNNIYSLSLAKEYLLKEDTLLLESDIIFEDSVLRCLAEDPRDSLALVARYESWMDGTCVRLSEGDRIEAVIPGNRFHFTESADYYKTVNLYKFGRDFSRTHYVPFLEAYTKALGNNEYYEQVLKVLVALDDSGIRAKRLDETQRWYEIDDIQDLDIAESMFAPDSQKTALIQKRYGGYWRYPKMLDFCYLVNCYYPPKKMMEEIKANFDALVCQYPSGMYVNSLLAARNFSLRSDQIIVGNGAAELIKSLLEQLKGTLGIIRPTFEEYAHRFAPDRVRVFISPKDGYAYTAQDIIHYFENHPADNLVLVNPDNPTGNYIPRQDIDTLIRWTAANNTCLILDESFLDFCSEPGATLLDESLLDANPHLIVIKSISKSYGIPGLRLGIAASSNPGLIHSLKKDVAIWNINSFGEFFMQIEQKYHKNYLESLDQVRTERARLTKAVEEIPHLRIHPSQSNFLMAELTGTLTATDLTTRLLTQYNLFIKDLTPKIPASKGQFIRIAVRNKKDDNLLLTAIKELLS